jgi:hypothetical protein
VASQTTLIVDFDSIMIQNIEKARPQKGLKVLGSSSGPVTVQIEAVP